MQEYYFGSHDVLLVESSIKQLRTIRGITAPNPKETIVFPVNPYPAAKYVVCQTFPKRGKDIPLGEHTLYAADRIAQAAGSFLIARVLSGSAQEERDFLTEILAEANKVYGTSHQSSWSGFPILQPVLYTMRTAGEVAKDGSQKIIELHKRNNELTSLNEEDLRNPKVGIYTPLSTDVINMAAFHRFMQTISPTTFEYLPVAASSDMRHIVLPVRENAESHFKQMEKIAVYVDVRGMGVTEEAIVKALQTVGEI